MTEHQSPHQDRRQYPRVEGKVPVKIYSDDFDIVTETKNLSRLGAYCRVNKYIEPLTKLKVHLLLSFKRAGKVVTKKVSCDGVIVRTEPEEGANFSVAIYFNDIQKRDAESITEFVNTVLGESKPLSET